MSLNTFFRYFGSKWTTAVRYPPPLHDTIIEPFAGSAGYATRYHRRKVILVDADERIAALWRYLIKVSAREILGLPLLERDGKVSDLVVSDEARLLIGYNVRRVIVNPADGFENWRAGNDANFMWGPVLRARLAAQVEKIRHWRIIHGSYEKAPNVRATWFLDPPYQTVRGGYGHDSDRIDFVALGNWARTRRGHVIACDARDANWLPFKALGGARQPAGFRHVNGKGEEFDCREVIWVNINDETKKEAPEQTEARQRRRAAR